jgi:hypothetical protein
MPAEAAEEAVEEGLEFGGVLLGEDGVAGAEAVGAGVGGDFGDDMAHLGGGGGGGVGRPGSGRGVADYR